jgi:hypothetical protein
MKSIRFSALATGAVKGISFLTDHAVGDRIINHLNITFVAERPPPP